MSNRPRREFAAEEGQQALVGQSAGGSGAFRVEHPRSPPEYVDSLVEWLLRKSTATA